ncbi:MAG TPA: metalloregulator ArsR/SmtB family transcription factor [Bacillales bacterium]|nr:metalloregulator ArsR/SmtB family transcription factor [Bacillales bacterium]
MARDHCDVYCYDEPKVNRLKSALANADSATIVKVFKALADETRIQIALALCTEEEICVCDVANTIGCTLASASHHLRLLRNMGLAVTRKEGKRVFYSLSDPHVKQLILQAFSHQNEVTSVGANS